MSKISIGAYLQTLREQQKISRSLIADTVGVAENTIWRIESGRQEPGGLLLASLLSELQGDFEDVKFLMSLKNPTAQDGKSRAMDLLKNKERKVSDTFPKDNSLAQAMELTLQLHHKDPSYLIKLIRYGRKLLQNKD